MNFRRWTGVRRRSLITPSTRQQDVSKNSRHDWLQLRDEENMAFERASLWVSLTLENKKKIKFRFNQNI